MLSKINNIIVIIFVIFIIVCTNIIFALANTNKSKKIISPSKGSVWHEGKIYTIKWHDIKEGVVCIAVLMGGHYRGTINSCDTCALQNQYKWKIPKGFVTGFGVDKDNAVRIVIYYKDNESNAFYSDYFTISK